MTRAELAHCSNQRRSSPLCWLRMLADSACLILTLSTYPLMTPRSLNQVSLWCTQKLGLRDLWSCPSIDHIEVEPLTRSLTAPERTWRLFGHLRSPPLLSWRLQSGKAESQPKERSYPG